MNAPLLQTPLGGGHLLARPGDRRLWWLDAPAALLWELHTQGLGPAALAELLTVRFGLPTATARAQVADLIGQWQQAGLQETTAAGTLHATDDPEPVPPDPSPCPIGAWRLQVADRAISLGVDDPPLSERLGAWLAPTGADGGPVDHRVHLHGPASAWRLTRDDQPVAAGQTGDAALLAVLHTLTGLGCRPAERLLVLHGAGLVTPAGGGLLLIAPSGGGKSTLATALDAAGFGLLSDDVVPVTLAGDLLGLGLPIGLKSGSWPVLATRRPDLKAAPQVARYDQPVRFLPLRTPPPTQPAPLSLLLLIRYQPNQPASAAPATPPQVLQGLLTAEAAIRNLTQTKLDTLARWVSTAPAYTLTYPDLDAALALIATLPLADV